MSGYKGSVCGWVFLACVMCHVRTTVDTVRVLPGLEFCVCVWGGGNILARRRDFT